MVTASQNTLTVTTSQNIVMVTASQNNVKGILRQNWKSECTNERTPMWKANSLEEENMFL
jgi:hypothetical protein